MQIATIRNSKNANIGLESNAAGAGGPIAGGGYNDNPTPGHSQTGVYAGIRHLF